MHFSHVCGGSVNRVNFICFLCLHIVGNIPGITIGSKVTPRIFGLFIVGLSTLSICISSTLPTSLVQRVNRVHDDFPGDNLRLLFFSCSAFV